MEEQRAEQCNRSNSLLQKNLNEGRQKRLMDADIASCNRLQSKVTVNRDFKTTVAMSVSVNRLTEAGGLRCPPPLMKIEK
jgi:hypothetical protein